MFADILSFLLFAHQRDVRRVSFDDVNAPVDVVIDLEGLQYALDVDWHGETDYIYWTDIGKRSVSRARWDGSGQEVKTEQLKIVYLCTTHMFTQVIIESELESPTGLAVEWVTNKLYVIDAGLSRIEVSRLDGSMRSVVVWDDLERPRDIVLHPRNGSVERKT